MTANQLRYWELIWRRKYEQQYIDEMKRHNETVERETARHNRAQERIDKQQLVINRIKLSQDWAKIDETERANIISEAISLKNSVTSLMQAGASQSQAETAAKEAQDKAQNYLAQQAVAVAEFAQTAIEEKNNVAQGWLTTEANLLKNGWTKGAVATAIGEIKAALSSDEFTEMLRQVAKTNPNLSWLGEMYGPEAPKALSEAVKSDVQSGFTYRKYPQGGRFLPDLPVTGHSGTQQGTTEGENFQDYVDTIKSARNSIPSRSKTDYERRDSSYSGGSNSTQSKQVYGNPNPHGHTSGGTNYYETGGQKSSAVIYSPGAKSVNFGPGLI